MSVPLQSTYSGPPRLVVFGGNGFVGSRVCQEGLKTGLAVASVNRSGAPKLDEPWVREVEWVRVSCSCTCGHHAPCYLSSTVTEALACSETPCSQTCGACSAAGPRHLCN